MVSGKIRVFLCGAHSTGKTTLLHGVLEQTDITGVPEVARQLIKDLDMHDYIDWENHPDKFEELQGMILDKQCEVERAHEHTDYMTDRGIDPLVYAKTYLTEEAYQRLLRTPAAQQSVERYRRENCLLFVIQPQKECLHDDGFRIPPKWRELCRYHDVMIEVLDSLGIPYDVIDFLDKTRRVEFVIEKIKERKNRLICDRSSDS